MTKHNQSGAVNGVVVSLILSVLLLIGALAFGGWAFNSRQDYKNNVDSKINVAVTAAQQKQTQADQAKFNEEAKQPLKTYTGPAQYGSVVLNYPKTWSAYIDDTDTNSQALVDGYFAPNIVPSIGNPNSAFALRLQVLPQSYSQVLQQLNSSQRSGTVVMSAYALPKVPNSVGVKAVGQVTNSTATVTMVIIPIRSNTLEVWTPGNTYLSDFNNNILPNLSFSP